MVGLVGESAMIFGDLLVAVPGLAGSVPDLNKTNATFGEAAGDEHLVAVESLAVEFANMLRLAANVERVAGFDLHAVGEFKGVDSRVHRRVVFVIGVVHCLDEIELFALLVRTETTVFDVGNQVCDGCFFGVDVGALVSAGEKG